MQRSGRVLPCVLLALAAITEARPSAGPGDVCVPLWEPTFGGGVGTSGEVMAMLGFDDGGPHGPRLYVGLGGTVNALAVYDDGAGDGPALYVGGDFRNAGGVLARRMAKWNRHGWAPVGHAMNEEVLTLAVHDDGAGGGEALYAGGVFTSAGGVGGARIARWDGSVWGDVGLGMDYQVEDLLSVPAGPGEPRLLYAVGYFTSAGLTPVDRVAVWDGTSWGPVGEGPIEEARVLGRLDDGAPGGADLYIGGPFTEFWDGTIRHIARWDGDDWSAVGDGVATSVYALEVFDTGGGAELYAGGEISSVGGTTGSGIAKWDGWNWAPLGAGVNRIVSALTTFDDGSGAGPRLYAGGDFTLADGMPANRIASWDGARWAPLGSGMSSFVLALCVFDAGSGGGPALVAGGAFLSAGGAPANRIAKWDGAGWSPLASGMNDSVRALEVYDEGRGGGPHLYAGGYFTTAGGVPARGIARWDGTSWTPLGDVLGGGVRAFAVFDDGAVGGPALFVGGTLTSIGGVPAANIARWDGTGWTPLDQGVNESVRGLAVFDDGGGPSLFAGGIFTSASGVSVSRVAKWDGQDWSALGTGTFDASVADLIAFDDPSGGGRSLVVAGGFQASPSGDSAIARWRGCACRWSSYCTATPNSTGQAAVIAGSGLPSLATGNFTLTASNLPPFTSAMFLYGSQPAAVPFGNGVRCVQGDFTKLRPVMITGAAGMAAFALDLQEPQVPLAAGETGCFQLWYRDAAAGGAGFNLSDALAVTFCE